MLFFFFFFVRPHLPFDLNQKQTTKKPTDPPPLPKRLPSFYLSLTSTFEILCMEKCGNGMMNVFESGYGCGDRENSESKANEQMGVSVSSSSSSSSCRFSQLWQWVFTLSR